MDKSEDYLADAVLVQETLVTYRALSRALKIHVNTAKSCLYAFARNQNTKKPRSVHATFLIYGKPVRQFRLRHGDSDINGRREEHDSGYSDIVPENVVTLAKEEQLEEVFSRYETVHAIQVYSVGPRALGELRMLSDPAQEVLGKAPTELLELLGTITNPAMTMRAPSTRRNAAPVRAPSPPRPAVVAGTVSAAVAADPADNVAPSKLSSMFQSSGASSTKKKAADDAKSSAKNSKKTSQESIIKDDASVSENAPPNSAPSSASGFTSSSKKPTAPKRGNIMAAFAKAKPKVKAPPATEQAPLSDDGDDDFESIVAAPTAAAKQKEPHGNKQGTKLSRAEREAELRRMMEQSDDDNKDEEDESEQEDEEEEEHLCEPEPMDIDEPPEEPDAEPEPEESKVEVEKGDASAGGRRRAKRLVKRKKQTMDEDGMLVTTMEDVWESFSEAEEERQPPPPAPKAKSSTVGQVKKSGSSGQGSITSFFSKK